MLEGGWTIACLGRLRNPELDAVELAPVAAGSLFGVRDTRPRGHEVQLARTDDCSVPRESR